MNGFEEYGRAMLLANEGTSQFANALGGAFKALTGKFRGWLRAMPTTLPPTESFQPK